MKKFSYRVLWFFSPITLLLIAVIVIDPYNYFWNANPSSDALKHNISYRLDYHLWKMIEYKKHPTPYIILGDSRADAIDASKISNLTHQNYYNLAFGGGTLNEIVDAFWYATRHSQLREVYIGVNFNLYGENALNRTKSTEQVISNPLKYLISQPTIKSTGLILYSTFFQKEYKVGEPEMTREEFWKYQIDVSARNMYEKFRLSRKAKSALEKIRAYCSENNIRLVFFIPPTHVDLQNEIAHYNLSADHAEFISDLKSLADSFYDFDFPNEFTENKLNFKDPFHTESDSLVINCIWGRSKNFVRRGNN